jgi:anti-sigma factor RsiW
VKHHTHLLEERLFDCYLAESAGEALDPRLAVHLLDCPACAARYADLTAFMDDLRAHGTAEADHIFTPERLRQQHQQILRRLEHVGHPARVLSFPERVVRRTMTPSLGSSRTPSRWIAGAAAAGLFIGVALGASYQFGSHAPDVAQTLARQSAPRLTVGVTRVVNEPQVTADDAFLSDLEVALERPHTRELVAFDAFTPHVREVGNR